MDKVRSRHRWALEGTSKVCEPLGLARKPCLEELAGVFASSGDGMNLKFNISSTDFRVPALISPLKRTFRGQSCTGTLVCPRKGRIRGQSASDP